MTWLVVAIVGAATILFKASGPVLLGRRPLPPRVAALVDVLAPAMLAALVVTQTVGGDRRARLRRAARRCRRGRGRASGCARPLLVVMVVAAAAAALDPAALGSLAMRVEEAVERIWPGRDAQIELLGGGITNRNFKVTLDDGAYVLRIGGKDTELLGIDRRVEHEASLAAAAIGVGPDVVASSSPRATSSRASSAVRPSSRRRCAGRRRLRRIAQSLRAVHAGPPIPARFDSFRVVEAYAAPPPATASGSRTPSRRARELANRIERTRGPAAERPCHNDLLATNFIDDGKRISIVDWEYAGMGDLFFDLANFSVNNGLSPDESRTFLESYFGRGAPEDERRLTLMRFMSDFREAMWGVLQQAVSELDFDFRGYAERHFERLERTASERAFRRALA